MHRMVSLQFMNGLEGLALNALHYTMGKSNYVSSLVTQLHGSVSQHIPLGTPIFRLWDVFAPHGLLPGGGLSIQKVPLGVTVRHIEVRVFCFHLLPLAN